LPGQVLSIEGLGGGQDTFECCLYAAAALELGGPFLGLCEVHNKLVVLPGSIFCFSYPFIRWEEVEVVQLCSTTPEGYDSVCFHKLVYISSLEAKPASGIFVLHLNWQEPRAVTAGDKEIESIVNEWKVDVKMFPYEEGCKL